MSQLRSRTSIPPLQRPFAGAVRMLPRVDDLVVVARPSEPLHCIRPAAIAAAARSFLDGFPGDVLYAVKCNPEPAVLRALWEGGVRHFDCASASEMAMVRQLFPEAAIHLMHPVKTRQAIRAAYTQCGVRDFALDSADELAKILDETRTADDLGLIVRVALPPGKAVYDLSGKFGASLEDAAVLLRMARPHVARLGVSFHVGSQCLEPLAYRQAMRLAAEAMRLGGVAVDIVDVGGGFPASYPGQEPPPLGAYLAEIEAEFEALGLPPATRLWAEPGRALVAGGASVVVQVLLRRRDALYVNDGVYGSLSDAGAPGFRFPTRLIRPFGGSSAEMRNFELFGPTCDSVDRMRGPFRLPEDVREGDWVEIGQLGAYGACLRTAFNGFDRAGIVEVRDPPLLETPGYHDGVLTDLAA
jgi:ornithine decarboxylase